ncbi:MAG: EAL domain-containing protein [Oscillospiraceae bacterium]|nr:EAL domain-containing protein [Oscillospiraceae bacterium]
MKVIYFDLCSIPLFLMILTTCYSRKMTKGSANNLFLTLIILSLVSAVSDLFMVILSERLPLSGAEFVLETLLANVYLATRNAVSAVLLLFLLSLTRMSSLIGQRWKQLLFSLPNVVILILLFQNLFTHTVFTVTAEAGYSRGVLMPLVYAMAAVYGLAGFIYCIYSKRFLAPDKWISLLVMYLMNYGAVVIQFFRPELLLEMFFSGIGAMGIMLSVMRPEERMDSLVGMGSWIFYQEDLRNVLRSGEHVQIVVIRLPNSREIINYLGDHRYNAYVSEIANEIRNLSRTRFNRVELYFERPGTIYLIADKNDTGVESIGERLLAENDGILKNYEENGVRFEPQICVIRCPDDLNKAEDIISLGHRFYKIGTSRQNIYRADEIVNSRVFAIESHMEEILKRAVTDHHIEMHYQPIYNVRSGGFHSAEALARIIDPEFGFISPALFIPAAEALGLIVPIGDEVLDLVFRVLSEHDPDALGIQYININLSVAQCMQSSLPGKIRRLERKYGVDPSRVNLEITETTFENISEVMLENVNELIRMGYNFALDDYGTGYSNIQRVNRLPLKLIKIDKSMLDEVSSANGRTILEHTVRMMQSIDKQLVAEGAETLDDVEILKSMNCDYIQGFYFSRPLPADEFIRYIEENNA